MDTGKLKKFAPQARNLLIDQVSVKLHSVLAEGSAARRENPDAVVELESQLRALGEQALIEKVAYTWFNRLSALRFMDATGLNTLLTVSPADGQSQPQILAEAMAGHIDASIVPEATAKRVQALLSGTAASASPQDEAYRLLLVAACNHWHSAMPFMFEKIADYTELLMPTGLLAPDSVLARLRKVMTEDACRDVEIIGWLYQFYISEKKQDVFDGLKKNVKITAENIPAATQLFTPHWIVRYLVENSLGRLWLLNRPQSRLAERMDYYIAPEEPETDFLKITRPEEIRICDPAAGSGHMLTYAFDLLYAIYEEEGYDATEIPALILSHNLTGVEIDDRAGALAAFALAMKAAGKLGRRRFLRMDAKPDICVLQPLAFSEAEMQDVAAVVGKDLFTDELRETLGQFDQAKNFGSLIVPKLRDPAETLRVAEARDFGGDLMLREVQERVVAVLRMAEALSPKYHVVVGNPPYMGGKGMNGALGDYAKKNYPDTKSDLYAAFIERAQKLTPRKCYLALVTMEGWMFLASYEKLRLKFLEQETLLALTHMPYLGKGGTPMGINFGTSAFVAKRYPSKDYRGDFCCVRYYEADEEGVPFSFPVQNERSATASTHDFRSIPGNPIAYWLGDGISSVFRENESMESIAVAKIGLMTSDNDQFLRYFWEVSPDQCLLNASNDDEAAESGRLWFPHNKGGAFRRWSGNRDYLVNWRNYGEDIKQTVIDKYPYLKGNPQFVVHDDGYYFKPQISWSETGSGKPSFRYFESGFTFNVGGVCAFPNDDEDTPKILAFLNSNFVKEVFLAINPTLHFGANNFYSLPAALNWDDGCKARVEWLIDAARADWDAYETSWDFTTLPLLSPDHQAGTLEATYARLRAHWQSMTDEMKRLEEENNRIFIDAYGLQDELTPEVPLNEITLTCNPAYRYGIKNDVAANETRLRADTMAEFLSYAVGCMFGRYSLDEPGLILANQGETLEDYLKRVPEPSFLPDDDNVIPILDGDWFPDDITERFRKFLRVTFGDEHFAENLRFIEEALGKDLRKFFLRDFYDDQVKRYKKRPIYWMFSSPKGSFNALIYMHRYRSDTASVVLNDYLREYMRKLEAHREQQQSVQADPSASASAKTKAAKEIDATAKILAELEAYERDVLYPLATQRVEIDLDDGVKANYPKFGAALKPIKGLSS